MEYFAAELMLQRCTELEFDQFDVLIDEMERSAKTGDVASMNAADVAFHSRIIELSDHQILRGVWNNYVQQIRRALTLRNQANHDLNFLVQLHRDLVLAFRAHDLEQVKMCYEAHGTDVPARLAHLFVEDN
jgi:DNA-binding GntR family transcriptional regulator